MNDRPLILASGSPRRADLLRQAGIRFDVSAPDVDETLQAGEAPEAYVRRLAAAKAGRVAASHPGRTVLGADTTVVVDGEVLGKPRDADDTLNEWSFNMKSLLSLLERVDHLITKEEMMARIQPGAKGKKAGKEKKAR